MSENMTLILEELKKLNNRIDSLDSNLNGRIDSVNEQLISINMRMDTMNEELRIVRDQTAKNTEQKVVISGLDKRVADLESDVKLLKKAITN